MNGLDGLTANLLAKIAVNLPRKMPRALAQRFSEHELELRQVMEGLMHLHPLPWEVIQQKSHASYSSFMEFWGQHHLSINVQEFVIDLCSATNRLSDDIFTFPAEREVVLANISVGELGFDNEVACLQEIYDRANEYGCTPILPSMALNLFMARGGNIGRCELYMAMDLVLVNNHNSQGGFIFGAGDTPSGLKIKRLWMGDFKTGKWPDSTRFIFEMKMPTRVFHQTVTDQA